jgi:hypothetical protein
MEYKQNRRWSDQYIPLISDIVGRHLLTPATREQDTTQATDLVVVRGGDMRVAARVRRPGYLSRYPDDFTIRTRAWDGGPTEMDKICSGWGDWMFYGHATREGVGIAAWMILDLDVFRWAIALAGRSDGWEKLATIRRNADGTELAAFSVKKFPGIVVHRSGSTPVAVHKTADMFSEAAF